MGESSVAVLGAGLALAAQKMSVPAQRKLVKGKFPHRCWYACTVISVVLPRIQNAFS